MRNIPATPHDALTQPILDYARNELLPRMKRVAPEADIAFEMGMDLPAFGIEADAPVVRWAMALAQTVHRGVGAVGFATEASVFQRAGIPTVVIGPGSIEQAHKPDEYISYEQVAACETFFARMIAQPMAGNG
jgi:acetylornithine deacetylase